jgi:F5/8 type C domain
MPLLATKKILSTWLSPSEFPPFVGSPRASRDEFFELQAVTSVSAFSFQRAGRLTAGALSFLALGAACAQGTNPGDLNTDPLTQGMAGTGTAGTSDGTTAGTSSAGDTAMPMAGTPSTPTAGTGGAVALGGMGGTSVVGGSGGAGGVGGVGGAGGKAGSGGGGAGGMAGSAGMAGSGGAAPTGYRYAKLVATSEQTGKVWSSVAELQIMTTGSVAISRTGWVVMADSEELVNQTAPATAAIDGDTATFWHTEWSPAPDDVNDAKLPHSLILDMTSAHTVTGFSYLPRQNSQNGRIKDYEFYVSKDGTNWGTALKKGAFPAGTALQTVTF